MAPVKGSILIPCQVPPLLRTIGCDMELPKQYIVSFVRIVASGGLSINTYKLSELLHMLSCATCISVESTDTKLGSKMP